LDEAACPRHLAQFNWATLKHDAGDGRVAPFIDNVARINRLAERMPGFLWRHQFDRRALDRLAKTRKLPFSRGKRFTTTLSVWRDLAALERFAFQTVHARFYDKRSDWFEAPATAYMVMWHVPQGHAPSMAEAVDRAEHLLRQGDSPEAFGWAYGRRMLSAQSALDQEGQKQERLAGL
jgi:hypothetical protein